MLPQPAPSSAADRPPRDPLPGYAELSCHSNFSFLDGASHPEELVARAARRGYAAIAITDEASLAGVVRAHECVREAQERHDEAERALLDAAATGLPPPSLAVPLAPPRLIVGAEMRLAADVAAQADAATPSGAGARLILLAQSRRGYGNLAQWISVARRRAAKGEYLALASDLEGGVPNAPHLAGLPGCFALLLPAPGESPDTLFAQAQWLKTWFGPERCALAAERLLRPGEPELMQALRRVAEFTGLPIAATGGVRMHVRARKPLLDVLTALRHRCTVAEAGERLAANAEAHLRSRQRLAQLYPPEWLAATLRIAAACTFSLAELRYEYPQEIVPAGHTPTTWLRELTERGLRLRYPEGESPKVRAAIEHELALIAQLGYEAYFLTVADVVGWAREQGICCQGRGSAANSAVCYALHVTEVDPHTSTLLFERFLSAERREPPDIDVDFEHQRREEVIQYLYAKYGRHRAALTAVVISYRPRSALRDVGRALGIDLDRITAVARSQQWWDGRKLDPERLREHGFDPAAPLSRLWLELAQVLMGFPRHLSQHPGGFVIARDDVSRLVPVENAAMADRTVIQWDKDDLDALGLIKVDVLALGMLSAIRRALAFVAFKLGVPTFRMQDVPREDKATYEMLCCADSIGVFQVESRAQMSMLPRLQPREFYDLVIEVAIVRPGPIQGGMVHPYLRRRSDEEPVDYPSAEVKQALGRTLGVPIFQEQVMQLAIVAADFTPGEADRLRRAMAAWKRKGGLGPFHERLVGRMVEKGYERAFAERIFQQIQGFGEYGFPESHAASFALLVYFSAWLKCHHPDAFAAALLNSQPMGFYAPAQLVRDAREHGVVVHPPCVLASGWDSHLEPGPVTANRHPVRLGLGRISGLAQEAGERIVAAREQGGVFESVEDLVRRAALDQHSLQALAAADALRALAGHRHQAAWAAAGVDTRATALLQRTRTREAAATLAAPTLGADLVADYRATGLSLKAHPLTLLRERLAEYRVQPARELLGFRNGQLARASGLVTHRQRPETAKGVVFVTLEDETGAVNVIVWPQVAERQRQPLLASTLLTVYGVWQCEGDVKHLIARRLVDHSGLLQGLNTKSRDFH